MLDLKRDRMSVFIVNAREEIVELWEELILGEAERNEFTPFTDGKFVQRHSNGRYTDMNFPVAE